MYHGWAEKSRAKSPSGADGFQYMQRMQHVTCVRQAVFHVKLLHINCRGSVGVPFQMAAENHSCPAWLSGCVSSYLLCVPSDSAAVKPHVYLASTWLPRLSFKQSTRMTCEFDLASAVSSYGLGRGARRAARLCAAQFQAKCDT